MKHQWIGILLFMYVFVPTVVYGAASRVTLFYREMEPHEGDVYNTMCAEAVKQGFVLVCKPAPAEWYRTGNKSFMAEVAEAATKGAVLMTPGPNTFTLDLTSFIDSSQNEPRYQAYFRMLDESPLQPMAKNTINLRAEPEVLVYNRQLLRELGVQAPQSEQTWDEFAQYMQVIMAKSSPTLEMDIRRIGLGFTTSMVELVARESDTAFSTMNLQGLYDDGFKWTLQVLSSLYAAGLPVTTRSLGLEQPWEVFKAGKIPIVRAYLSQVLELPPSFDWVVTPFPSGPNGRRSSSVGLYKTLGIAANSKDPQAGWEVLLWLAAGNGAKAMAKAYPLSVTAPLIFNGPDLPRNLANRGIESVFSISTLQFRRGWSRETWQAFTEITPPLTRYIQGELSLGDALSEMERIVLSLPPLPVATTTATMSRTVTYSLSPRLGAVRVKIHVLMFNGLAEWLPQAIRSKFKNIDVEVLAVNTIDPARIRKQVVEAAESGEFDLFVMGGMYFPTLFSSMVQNKLLTQLDPLVTKRGFPLATLGSLANQMRVGGRLYDIPLVVSPDMLYCNQSVFAVAGVPISGHNWTWEEFQDIATGLTRNVEGMSIRGFTHTQPGELWYTLVYQLGYNPMTADKDVLDTAASIITGLQDRGALSRGVAPNRDFVESRTGITLGTIAMAPKYVKETRFPISLMPLPSKDKSQMPTTTSVVSVGIAATSKHQAEAWQVIEFLTSDESALQMSKAGFLPARLNAANVAAWTGANWPEKDTIPSGLDILPKLNLILTPSRHFGSVEEALRTAMMQQMDAVLSGTASRLEAIMYIERLRQELLSQGSGKK